MMKTFLVAGVLGLVFAGSASAMDIVRCTAANMDKIHNEAAAMTAPSQKHAMEMTMKQLEMASAMIAKGDVAGCREHMGMAMEDLHAK